MSKHLKKIIICFFMLAAFLSEIIHAEEKPEAKARTASPAKDEKITLNFIDVELSSVVKLISELTGKSFIYDDRIKGKITIIAPARFNKEEAFNLFTSVLELKGFTIVESGSVYKIIPSSMVKQSSTGVFKGEEKQAVNDTYIARLIPLAFIQAQEAMPLLQPLVSKDGFISVFGAGNSILVLDTSQNIEKILDIVRLVDAEQAVYPPEIVYLKFAQADTIAQILKQGNVGKRGGSSKTGQSPQDSTRFTTDARLNGIILFGPPEEKDDYKRFIAVLDAPLPEASSKINVYYMENADAQELAKVLEGITRQISSPPPPGAPGMPATVSEFTGRVSITPDKATNSLIIMASPSDYHNLSQIIKKLDRRPKQVVVEAMITEVSIDRALDLGTKWRASVTKDDKPVLIGGVGTVDQGTIQTVISGMAGLSIGGLGNYITVPFTRPDGTNGNLNAPGFAALFSLSEFKDVVNVLSTPHILTSDNKEAEIVVGENVPFRGKLEREATTANQPVLQSIERKDVGITLKIKPQISEGDYVKLDIYQEISSIAPSSQTGGAEAADLITSKRSAKTSVVVKDRQTIVIGGLIQDKEIRGITKVPLLGDIPLLGWLFKFTTSRRQKTNLLIYLTPTLIKDFESLDEVKNRREESFNSTAAENSEKNDSKETDSAGQE